MNNSDDTEIIVRAIIVYDEKLLICRAKDKGHYFMPGGHTEPEESLEQALEREIQEETGKQIISSEYLGNLPNTYSADEIEHYEINHVFLTQLSDYRITSMERHIDFKWVEISQISELEILPENLKTFIQNKVENLDV